MENKTKERVKSILIVMTNAIYWPFLFALVGVTLWLVYQQIQYPDKIPNVFGYKMFMILDEYMTDDLQNGDLAIVKMVPTDEIKVKDAIAFRNNVNLVTIHEIKDIQMRNEKKWYQMIAASNETADTKTVSENLVEGRVVHKIPWIGLILYEVQRPVVMGCIILFILIIGSIALWIARRLDAKEEREKREMQKTAAA